MVGEPIGNDFGGHEGIDRHRRRRRREPEQEQEPHDDDGATDVD